MIFKKKTMWVHLLILLISLSIGQVSSQAAEKDPAGAAGFVYTIDYPENQVAEDLGYYHLKMSPGDKQDIAINLSNPGTEAVTVDVAYNSAKTNQNGVIEYGTSRLKADKSMKFEFADVVKGPKSIELKPGENKTLTLTAQLPETTYDGVIAGGIQLMRANQDEASDSSGSRVVNQYAYVIGMLLQETDKTVLPDLTLNSIRGDQTNYRNAVFVNLSNTEASYLDDMTVEVQVMKKGNDAVLYERKQDGMRMAPNSTLDFPVSMSGQKMAAGDYEGHVLVTAGDKKWEWTEGFKITQKEADKYNERDVSLVQDKGINWLLVIGIASGIFILLIGSILIARQIGKKKGSANKSTPRNKQTKNKKSKK